MNRLSPRFLKYFLLISAPLVISIATSYSFTDWKTADRSSAGIAPTPENEPEAIVQLYAARAVGWRGPLAVHTWLATKEKGSDHYKVYQVIGWRLYRNLSPVVIEKNIPDRRWFGAEPKLLLSLKGERAEKIIPRIQEVAELYPYPQTYRAWPGPNSNSFISFIIRHIPEFGMELPSNAIGKDWIGHGDLWGLSESGTGVQVSLFGILGLTLGLNEGIEINILGLCFGLDIFRPALKLPFLGRIGLSDKPFFEAQS